MRYLSIFISSAGGRWLLLPGIVSGIAAFVILLKGLGATWIPEISYWALALFFLLPVSAWSIPALVKKVSELQSQLDPQISIRFEPREPWVRQTPANFPHSNIPKTNIETDSIFVRFKVENIKEHVVARDCQAFLTDVQFKGEDGKFAPTNYGDSLRLAWSTRPHPNWYQATDIPAGTSMFVDLLSVDKEYNKIIVKWEQDLLVYKKLFENTGEYKFDVLATSDMGKSARAQIAVKWTGKWHEIEACPISDPEKDVH